jgi:hypothetical protein
MGKLTRKEIKNFKIDYVDELDENSEKIYNAIGYFFTKDRKLEGIKDIVKLLSETGNTYKSGCFSKYFYELVYLNEILSKIIRVYGHYIPTLVVAKSKIHGIGVFADEDIKRGRIVTFYPIHYIIEDNYKVYTSPEIISSTIINKVPKNINEYALTGKEDELLVISANREIQKEYQYGHLINHSSGPNTYFQLVNSYNTFMCNIWVIISTKDIKKGEELTVNYGPRFKLR